jgi:hypothetical protein
LFESVMQHRNMEHLMGSHRLSQDDDPRGYLGVKGPWM